MPEGQPVYMIHSLRELAKLVEEVTAAGQRVHAVAHLSEWVKDDKESCRAMP